MCTPKKPGAFAFLHSCSVDIGEYSTWIHLAGSLHLRLWNLAGILISETCIFFLSFIQLST